MRQSWHGYEPLTNHKKITTKHILILLVYTDYDAWPHQYLDVL